MFLHCPVGRGSRTSTTTVVNSETLVDWASGNLYRWIKVSVFKSKTKIWGGQKKVVSTFPLSITHNLLQSSIWKIFHNILFEFICVISIYGNPKNWSDSIAVSSMTWMPLVAWVSSNNWTTFRFLRCNYSKSDGNSCWKSRNCHKDSWTSPIYKKFNCYTFTLDQAGLSTCIMNIHINRRCICCNKLPIPNCHLPFLFGWETKVQLLPFRNCHQLRKLRCRLQTIDDREENKNANNLLHLF